MVQWWQSLPDWVRSVLLVIVSATIGALLALYREALAGFLRKFGELLSAIGGGRLREQRFEQKYLKWFVAFYSKISLVGVPTVGQAAPKPKVEEIFVAPWLTAFRSSRSDIPGTLEVQVEGIPYPPGLMRERGEVLGIGELLSRHRDLVLLGDPGAGKTTLLQYVGLVAAKARLGKRVLLKREGIKFKTRRLLPIFVPLRSAAESEVSLMDFLDGYVKEKSGQLLDPPSAFFRRRIEHGNCLLLLDGLDEVPGSENHRAIARAIESLLAIHPDNYVVVTSRTAGWKGLLSTPFSIYALEDFREDQTTRFVHRWYMAVCSQSLPREASAEQRQSITCEASTNARNLLDAIYGYPRIERLSGNPLLLSVMASVHRTYAVLPRERAKLYERCTDLLLEHWDVGLGRTELLATGLSLPQKQALVRRVAFELHERGWRQAQRSVIEELVSEALPGMGQKSSRAPDLIRWLEQRTGLLAETEEGVLSFVHLAFQEYFAAQAVEQDIWSTGSFHLLLHRDRLLDNWWREVILLYAGLTTKSVATEFISAIYQRDQADVFRRHLFLAAECLAEASEVQASLRNEVIAVLCDLWLYGPYRRLQEMAGELLAKIRGDDVVRALLDAIEWEDCTLADQKRALKVLGKAQVYSREVASWISESLTRRSGPELADLAEGLLLKFSIWSETVRDDVLVRMLTVIQDENRCWWDKVSVLMGITSGLMSNASRYRNGRVPPGLLRVFHQSLKTPDPVPVQVPLGALIVLLDRRLKITFQVGMKCLSFLWRNRRLWRRELRELAVLFAVSNVLWLISVLRTLGLSELARIWRLAYWIGGFGPFIWRQAMRWQWMKDKVTRYILLGLQAEDPFVSALALYAIWDETCDNHEVVSLLAKLLRDRPWFVQLGVVQAIGVLRRLEPSMVHRLQELIEEDDYRPWRFVVLNAIRELDPAEFAVALRRQLLDRNETAWHPHSVWTLARLESVDESTLKDLLLAMRNPERWTRVAIINVLAEIGLIDMRAAKLLFGVHVRHGSRYVSWWSNRVWTMNRQQSFRIIEEDILPLFSSASMFDRWLAAELSAEIPYAKDKLIETLQLAGEDEYPPLRESAANALIKLGARSSLPAEVLSDALGDEEQITRDWAFDALWTLGEKTGQWVAPVRLDRVIGGASG